MSGPGGDQVAKVGVRVVPDSGGFRRDLERALEQAEAGLEVRVPVEFDVDPNELRSKLAAINARLEVPVELNPDVAGLRARLRVLESSRVVLPVDLEPNIAGLRAQLATLSAQDIRINVELTGVAAAIAELRVLETLVRSLDGQTIRINLNISGLAGALAQLAALAAALAAIRGIGGGGGGLGGFLPGWAGVIAAVAGKAKELAVQLAVASAAATAIAVAGAAITGAWGAASTAVAAVPAALALVAAPIATVIAGFDGIKKAAQTLKPEIDKLKGLLNATFERGLAPVFDKLKATFPALTGGMHDVAHSLIGISDRLADMVASEPGIARIDAVFKNVKTSLDGMAPGIAAVADSLLILASQSGAFEPLTRAVNEFGTRFRANVLELIGNGTMDRAFRGLADLTGIAARGFADLVKNGIELFAAAAPGMNAGLQSISDFFNRFDWTSLGESVGGVFRGLGEALDRVPQSTIDGIEASFARLATTFRDPAFQTMISNIISMVPTAIDFINGLVQAFARMGSFLAGLAQLVIGTVKTISVGFQAASDPIGAMAGKYNTALADAATEVALGTQKIKDAFAPMPSVVGGFIDQTANTISTKFRAMPQLAGKDLGPLAELFPEILGPMPAQAGAALAPLPGTVGAAIAPVAGEIDAALAPAEASTTTALTRIQTAMQTGFAQLAPQVGTQLQGVLLTVTTSFSQMATIASDGMLRVQTAMTTGSSGWSLATGVAMQGVMLALSTGFSQLATTASAGMTTIAAAITTGAVGWANAVTAGMATVRDAVTNGFLIMAASVSLAMNTLTNTLTLGFVTMQTVAANGMLGVQTAITNGFANTNASATTAMTLLQNAVRVGMNAIIILVTDSMLALRTLFTTGWADIDTGARQAMLNMETIVRDGLTNMVTSARTGMTQFQTEIRSGLNRSLAEVRMGITAMLNALRGAVPQFRTAGANMGQALADGLNSKAGVVEAAARRLANAAAAAMRAAAQIRSPSKVFIQLGSYMGEGTAIGLASQEHRIIAEAKSIVDGIADEFARAQNLDPTIGFDGGSVVASVRHSIADSALVGAGVGGRGDVNVVVNEYVPDAERGADRVAQNMRRLSAMGLFG